MSTAGGKFGGSASSATIIIGPPAKSLTAASAATSQEPSQVLPPVFVRYIVSVPFPQSIPGNWEKFAITAAAPDTSATTFTTSLPEQGE